MRSRDRERRVTISPARFAYVDVIAYALNIGDTIEIEEPTSYLVACKGKDKQHWLKAMMEEIHSLQKNNTWQLVDRVVGKRVIGYKQIFK